ncbi:MAG: hypothetical protein GY838_02025 [bacterium]|nr:hypothetical protein [bacterium]
MVRRELRFLATAALAVALGVCSPSTLRAAATGDAESDSLAQAWEEGVASQRGWLNRTLHRFFGRAPQSGEELSGRAEQTLDPFAEFAGRPIEVVIVHPVLRFDPEAADSTSATAWLSSLARRAGSYTHERVFRQYLLFARGHTLDPYKLADSERLLRQLPYVNDARLLVLPVGDAGGGVAVIVEYRDRWPYGVSGRIKTEDRYEVSFYTHNLGGVGLLFDHKIIRNNLGEPATGYRGRMAKGNLFGTFVDGILEYEDSWSERRRYVEFQRRDVHPAISHVGGVSWRDTDDRDNEDVPRVFEDTRAWMGRVVELSQDRTFASGVRRTLTPAVSFSRRWFTDRPYTAPDTNRAYHHGRTWLAGLTYQRLSNYKTSYLFRMGEVEDIPAGVSIQINGGYDDGEHRDRTVGFVDFGGVQFRPRGDLVFGGVALGGYLRAGHFEDGQVDATAAYVTRLTGGGRYRHRTLVWLRYTLGINRTGTGRLKLGDGSSTRNLTSPGVRGNQRLMASVEFRLFTPWSVAGFRMQDFAYTDLGLVGTEDDAIFQQKIYSSTGLGVRLDNPDLVLPTIELRGSLTRDVDGRSFSWAVDLGNLIYPELRLPGVRPGKVSFR